MAEKNEIRVGIAGIGFMGVTHFNAFKKVKGARVVAIAETDDKKRTGDWSDVRGNFGSGGGIVDLSKYKVFARFESMVADPDIDLIDICLPTPFHTKMTVYALQAGKNVLVEKPISTNLRDADLMIGAARKARRHLFVGQVLRYFPEYRYLKSLASSGKYGKLLAAHFRRIIAMPDWGTAGKSWFADTKKSGGAGVDLHIHDVDYVMHLLGKPKSVSATGVPGTNGTWDYLAAQYSFGKGGPAISSEGGWIAAKGLPFEQSYEAYFEKASVLFNSSHGPLTLVDSKGNKTQPKLPTQDGFVAELSAIINPLLSGEEPKELLGVGGRNALALCLAEQASAKSGKPVKVA